MFVFYPVFDFSDSYALEQFKEQNSIFSLKS